MKRKILISVLLCVAVLSVGLTGCVKKPDEPAPTTTPLATLQGKMVALETWQGTVNSQLADKPTRAEMNTAITAGATPADLSALTARVATLEGEVNTLEAENTTLEARIADLEAGAGNGTTPTTGEVTVAIVEATPLQVISSAGGSVTSFTVRITNGTDAYRYVGYSLSLVCTSYDRIADVGGANLSTFGAYGLVFDVLLSPCSDDPATPPPAVECYCQQILLYPSAGSMRISVAAGGTVEISHMLETWTAEPEQWEGNLTGVVVSTTW